MVSPVGVAPASLLVAGQKAAYIVWLNANIPDQQLRRYLLIGWAKQLGVSLAAADYVAIGFPEPEAGG